MKKNMLLKAIEVTVTALYLSGCGAIDVVEDAFTTEETKRPSTISIDRNTLGVITIPSTGVSVTPPTYQDFNASEVEPPAATYSVRKYPKNGMLTFSGNLAIYKPNKDYVGKDFFSFDIFDEHEDEVTIYDIDVIVKDTIDDPKIVGTLPSEARVGEKYYAKISIIESRDTSGFTFYAENMPIWMTIDPKTGEISGTPTEGDVGDSTNILIHADSSMYSLTLPPQTVSVLVGATTQAPEIAGVPTTVIKGGDHYTFTPTVKDADTPLSELSFEVANKPYWADFDIVTGELSGVPTYDDDGNTTTDKNTYPDVVISVKDDTGNVASLPPFTITVTE